MMMIYLDHYNDPIEALLSSLMEIYLPQQIILNDL